METFTIQANEFLEQPIEAWYHSEYHVGQSQVLGSIENLVCTLKNDINVKKPDDQDLLNASDRLYQILLNELQTIQKQVDFELTVGVVPRAKVEYLPHQLLFKETIKRAVSHLNLRDGTDYIVRTRDTRTTHRNRAGYGGDGPMPYVGITNDTCAISGDVEGKNILLIDDVSTPDINIDEDAIQALLDNGAARVLFYAVGKTVRND